MRARRYDPVTGRVLSEDPAHNGVNGTRTAREPQPPLWIKPADSPIGYGGGWVDLNLVAGEYADLIVFTKYARSGVDPEQMEHAYEA